MGIDEVTVVAIVVVTVNAIFDAVFVSWLAAKRGPTFFSRWLRSDAAKPDLDVIAEHVKAKVLPGLPDAKALEAIRVDLGHMHAELSAEMPPNIDGRVAEMEKVMQDAMAKVDQAVAQIAAIDQGIGHAFSVLDGKLGTVFGLMGQEETAIKRAMETTSGEVEGAVQSAMRSMDTRNPLVRNFYLLANKPLDEKWAAKHPYAAMFQEAGKAWFAQNILPQLAGEEGGMPALPGTDLARLGKESKIL